MKKYTIHPSASESPAGFTLIQGSDGVSVAEVYGSDMESQGLATLFISAPEMLEALKTIAEYCDRSFYSPKIELYVKALIVKAEGGAE